MQWALHEGFPKGKLIAEGPMILWTPSEIGQTQVFTCIALNSGAGNIGQVSKTVIVVGELKYHYTGASWWIRAGILFLRLKPICVLFFYFFS